MNKPAITALITIQEINNSNNSMLPDSHLKDFGGKPMYRIMIDKLLAISAIKRIVITTDSEAVEKGICRKQQDFYYRFPESGYLFRRSNRTHSGRNANLR